MPDLTLDRAKAIYRAAVDAQASDTEGEAWWAKVHAELGQVLAARTATEAAQVIAWWHHDWTTVGDTAKDAAQRIRAAARAAAHWNGKRRCELRTPSSRRDRTASTAVRPESIAGVAPLRPGPRRCSDGT